MGGTGWCTHPKRQLSNDVRILVRKAELACRNAWGIDYWEALDSASADDPPVSTPAPSEPRHDHPSPIQGSFEDEVTSVVNTDIHRALTNDDLNDRVVEQTSLGTEDDDDRFNLLARGGQDSVSEARNRMLRRRAGSQAPLDADEDTNIASSRSDRQPETGFLPDDYVEEEAPSPEKQNADKTAIAPDDDVILSENVSQGTPRSRRLRRIREQPVAPKPQAVVETDTDVATPAIESSQNTTIARGRFDSVPEISAEIDLSRLRGQTPRGEESMRRASAAISSPSAPTAMEEPFERAIRTAQAIKAAAKAEREERKTDFRPRGATIRAAAHEPHQPATPRQPLKFQPADVQEIMEEPFDQDLEAVDFSSSTTHQRSARASVSTRHIDELGLPNVEEYEIEEDTPLSSVSRRESARGSWWRGLFQSRHNETSDHDSYEESWAYEEDVYEDVRDDDFEHESPIAAASEAWRDVEPDRWQPHVYNDYDEPPYEDEPLHEPAYVYAEDDPALEAIADTGITDAGFDDYEHHEMASAATQAQYEPLDLQHEQGLSAFRDRLFVRGEEEMSSPTNERRVTSESQRSPISLARKRSITRDEPMRAPAYEEAVPRAREGHQAISWATTREQDLQSQPDTHTHTPAPVDLLDHPEDAWYEPEHDQRFDVRDLIAQSSELLDMTIEVSPQIPRECATCRSYRQSEQGERGWCTNNWAFTHRQMVNATDLACQSTIGCWWLPADEEVWLTDDEPERGGTPRVDRLIAHLDPLKKAVGR